LRGATSAYNNNVSTTMRRVLPGRHVFVARNPGTSMAVITNDPANAAGAVGAGDEEVTPAPGIVARLAAGPSAPAGANADAQLAQARELEAKLAEEYRTVRLLRASMTGEASARGERVRELGRQARDRINADNPNMLPRASQKLVAAVTLLRAMPAPSTPKARDLHREV
jgi:hypothetical protein